MRTAWCLLLLCCLGMHLLPARGHAEVVERVVAVVNEEAILLSELRRRAVPFLPQVVNAPSEVERMSRLEQLYDQLLGSLIDEHLIEQAAKDMQITVTSDEIDQAVANVRDQSGLDDAGFWDAVAEQGLTREQYRVDVRRQLLRLKVVNQRVRSRVNITKQDVEERYQQMLRAARRTLRFRAAHVFLEVPDGATATEVAKLRRQADDIRKELDAKSFFGAIETHGGGELGWLSQGDLPETLEQTLLALEEGTVSAPVRGPSGYHIFLLQERQQTSKSMPSFEDTREPLYRKMLEEAMARQEEMFLDDLRREAVIVKRL